MGTVIDLHATPRNPMVYDIMCEAAYWLQGEYLARERAAEDDAERNRWRDARYRADDEMRAVDYRDQSLVRAKTAEFTERRKALPPLR